MRFNILWWAEHCGEPLRCTYRLCLPFIQLHFSSVLLLEPQWHLCIQKVFEGKRIWIFLFFRFFRNMKKIWCQHGAKRRHSWNFFGPNWKFKGSNWGTWYFCHVYLKTHSNVHVNCCLSYAAWYKNHVPQLLPLNFQLGPKPFSISHEIEPWNWIFLKHFMFFLKHFMKCFSLSLATKTAQLLRCFFFVAFHVGARPGAAAWEHDLWSAPDQEMVGANIDNFSSFIFHHSCRSKLQCMCKGGNPQSPRMLPSMQGSRCGSEQLDRPLYSVEEEVHSAVRVCVCVWSAHAVCVCCAHACVSVMCPYKSS